MNNKLEVIGIDHGWSMMKTISQVFVTGVKEITTTAFIMGLTVHKRRHQATASAMSISQHRR